MNDKLTEEIIIGIRDIPHYLHEMEQTAAADRLIKAIHRLEVLAQQVQLLKGADEERARLRKAIQQVLASSDTTHKGKLLVNALAASPTTGYTERLEQFLENEVRHQACKTTDRCLFQGRVADLCDTAKQLLSDHATGNQ